MTASPWPAGRVPGLRLRRLGIGTGFWRLDRTESQQWDWGGFDVARHRFDPHAGTFRTRYAATSIAGAFRERYADTGLFVPADHADHFLVHLSTTRPFQILDLRTEANLFALGIDDRISTGHERDIWDACHHLVDAIRRWWPDLDGIVYRSRTTPESSANLAFWSTNGLDAHDRILRTCGTELDDLVLRHHLTVDFPG